MSDIKIEGDSATIKPNEIDKTTGLPGGNQSNIVKSEFESDDSIDDDVIKLAPGKIKGYETSQDHFLKAISDPFTSRNLSEGTFDEFGVTRDNVEDFQEIFESNRVDYLNPTLFNDAADAQSGWRLLGSSMMQLASETGLTAAEGFATMFDPELLGNMIEATVNGEMKPGARFDNFMTRLLNEGKEHVSGEAFNIYQTDAAKSGIALNDGTWWAANAPSIGSSLSLMVPGFAVGKGIGYLGKAARALRGTNTLSRGLKGLARTSQNFAQNSPALMGTAQTVGHTLMSRGTENTMEASQVYAQAEDQYKLDWQERNPGKTMKETDIEMMKQYAGNAAAKNFQANTALLAVDALQFGLAFMPFGKQAGKVQKMTRNNAYKELDDLGVAGAKGFKPKVSPTKQAFPGAGEGLGEFIKKSKVGRAGKWTYQAATGKKGKFVGNFGAQALTEAGEEGYQYLSGQAALEAQKYDSNMYDEMMLGATKYKWDPEMYTSMFFGALGGVAFGSIAPAIGEGYKSARAGTNQTSTPGQTASDALMQNRKALLGDKAGFHKIQKNELKKAVLEHSREGRVDDLTQMLQAQLEIAEQSDQYTDEDIAEIKSNIAFTENLANEVAALKSKMKGDGRVETEMVNMYADMLVEESLKPEIEQEYTAATATPEARKLGLHYQKLFVELAMKEGNIAAQSKDGQKVLNKKLKEIDTQLEALKDVGENQVTGSDIGKIREAARKLVDNQATIDFYSNIYNKLQNSSKARKDYEKEISKGYSEDLKRDIRLAVARGSNEMSRDEFKESFVTKNKEYQNYAKPSVQEENEMLDYVDKVIDDKNKYINDNVWGSAEEKSEELKSFLEDAINGTNTIAQAEQRFMDLVNGKMNGDKEASNAFAENHGFNSLDEMARILTDDNLFDAAQYGFVRDFYPLEFVQSIINSAAETSNPVDHQSFHSETTVFETKEDAIKFVSDLRSNKFGIELIKEAPVEPNTVEYRANKWYKPGTNELVPNQELYKIGFEGTPVYKRHYKVGGKIYKGVTNSIIKKKWATKGGGTSSGIGLEVGSEVDAILKDVFARHQAGDPTPINRLDYTVNGRTYLTDDAFNELIESAREFINRFNGLNVEFYTEGLLIHSPKYGVASEIDILVLDKDNATVAIADFKTSKDDLESSEEGSKQKVLEYKRQLSAYRLMLAETYEGVQAEVNGIIEVNTKYENDATQTEKATVKNEFVTTGHINDPANIFIKDVVAHGEAYVDNSEAQFNKLAEETEENLQDLDDNGETPLDKLVRENNHPTGLETAFSKTNDGSGRMVEVNSDTKFSDKIIKTTFSSKTTNKKGEPRTQNYKIYNNINEFTKDLNVDLNSDDNETATELYNTLLKDSEKSELPIRLINVTTLVDPSSPFHGQSIANVVIGSDKVSFHISKDGNIASGSTNVEEANRSTRMSKKLKRNASAAAKKAKTENNPRVYDTFTLVVNDKADSYVSIDGDNKTITINEANMKKDFDNGMYKQWGVNTFEQHVHFAVERTLQAGILTYNTFAKGLPYEPTEANYSDEISKRTADKLGLEPNEIEDPFVIQPQEKQTFLEGDKIGASTHEKLGEKTKAGKYKKRSQLVKFNVQELGINPTWINGNNIAPGDEVFFAYNTNLGTNKRRLGKDKYGNDFKIVGDKAFDTDGNEYKVVNDIVVAKDGTPVNNAEHMVITAIKYTGPNKTKPQIVGYIANMAEISLGGISSRLYKANKTENQWVYDVREKAKKQFDEGQVGDLVEIEGFSSKIRYISHGSLNLTGQANNPNDYYKESSKKPPLIMGSVRTINGQLIPTVENFDRMNEELKEVYGDQMDLQNLFYDEKMLAQHSQEGQVFRVLPALNGKGVFIDYLKRKTNAQLDGRMDEIKKLVGQIADPTSDPEFRASKLDDLFDLTEFNDGTLGFNTNTNRFEIAKNAKLYSKSEGRKPVTPGKDTYDADGLIDYLSGAHAFIDFMKINSGSYNEDISNQGMVTSNLDLANPIVNPKIVLESAKQRLDKVIPENPLSTPEPEVKPKKKRKTFLDVEVGDGTDSPSGFDHAYHIQDISNSPKFKTTIANARAWMLDRFPQIPLEVIDSIIEISKNGGIAADGVFQDSMVKVLSSADGSVVYHEAAHAVFRMFNSPEQQKLLIEEAKKDENIPNHTKSDIDFLRSIYPQKSDAELENIYYEEQIVEGFREYVTDKEGDEPGKRSFGRKVADFFSRLYHYLKEFLGKGPSLNDFYSKMNVGYYKNTKPTDEYSKKVMNDTMYNPLFNANEMHRATKALTGFMSSSLLEALPQDDLNKSPYSMFKTQSDYIRIMKYAVQNVFVDKADQFYELGDDAAGERLDLLGQQFIQNIDGKLELTQFGLNALNSLPNLKTIDNKILEMSIDDIEGQIDEDNDIDETQVYQEHKDLKSAFDKASTAFRLYLAAVPKLSHKHEIERDNDSYMLYNDPGVLFKTLVNTVTDSINELDVKNKLADAARKNPTIGLIYDDLYGDGDVRSRLGLPEVPSINEIRNKLLSNIGFKFKSNIVSLNVIKKTDPEDGTVTYEMVPYDANADNKVKAIWDQAKKNMIEGTEMMIDGKIKDGSTLQWSLMRDEIFSAIQPLINARTDEAQPARPLTEDEATKFFKLTDSTLRKIGIEVESSVIRSALQTDVAVIDFLGKDKGININKRTMNLHSLLNEIANKKDIIGSKSWYPKKTIRYLTDSIEAAAMDSYVTPDGKTRYVVGSPGYDERTIMSFTKAAGSRKRIEKAQNTSAFHKNAPIYELLDTDSFSRHFRHIKFGAITEGNNITEYKNFAGTTKYLETAINFFFKNGNDTGYFFSAVNGDGTTATGFEAKKYKTKAEVKKAVKSAVLQEAARIIEFQEQIKIDPSKANRPEFKNGTKFINFPFMNKILNDIGAQAIFNDSSEQTVLTAIDTALNDLADKNIKFLKDKGVLNNEAFDSKILSNKKYINYNEQPAVGSEEVFRNMMYDFVAHDLFLSTQVFTLLQNDPAYYQAGKKEDGSKDWGNVGIDVGKRGKEVHSPVNYNISVGDNIVRALILNDESLKTIHSEVWYKNLTDKRSGLTHDRALQKLATLGGWSHEINENGDLVEVINMSKERDLVKPQAESLKKAKAEAAKEGGNNKFVLLSNGKLSPAKGNDTTDGATYISIEQWKDTMKGQTLWTKKHQKLYDAVKNKQPIPNDVYDLAMSPLKMFRYEHIIEKRDDEFGTNTTNIPFQQKDAKFLLVEQLTGGNPKLKQVLKLLDHKDAEGNKLKEVSYSSAVKVGGLRVVNLEDINSGNIGSVIKDNQYILNHMSTGIQVNTMGEHKERRSGGSQMLKLIIENVNKEALYDMAELGMKTGAEMLDMFNESIRRDIETEFRKLTKNLINTDDIVDRDGNPLPADELEDIKVSAMSRMIDKITDTARMLGYGDNFINAIQMEGGKSKTPLYSGQLIEKIESLMFAEFRKKVLKIMSPGGSYVNAPSLGRADDLQYSFNEDGSLEWIEVDMSPHFHEQVEFFADENGVIDPTLLPDNLRESFMYRIPTEAKYSMFKIKVRKFLPSWSAHQIVMPREATTISGFDFDIDKLFAVFAEYDINLKTSKARKFMRKNMQSKFKGEFDGSDGAKKIYRLLNTSKNDIIENVHDEFNSDSIAHKEYLNEIMKEIKRIEGKTGKASSIVTMKKVPASNNYTRGRANVRYNTYMAIMSNENHKAEISTPADFDPFKDEAAKQPDEGDSSIWFQTALGRQQIVDSAMSGNQLKAQASLARTSHAWTTSSKITVNGIPLYRNIIDETGVNIQNNLSAFLAAILDNQKFPLSAKLNINTATADMFIAILRTGMSIPNAVKIMKSPTVVSATNQALKEGRKVESVIAKRLKRDTGGNPREFSQPSKEAYEELVNTGNTGSINFDAIDLHFLNFIGQMSGTIAQLTYATQAGTNGTKSFANAESKMDSFNDLLQTEFDNPEFVTGFDEFINDKSNPYYWTSVMNEYAIDKIPGAISQMTEAPFLEDAFRSIKSLISELSGKTLNEKQIKMINMATLNGLTSETGIMKDRTQRFNLITTVPGRIQSFINKYPNSGAAFIMRHATVMPGDDVSPHKWVKKHNKISDPDKVDITRVWSNSMQEGYEGDGFDMVTKEEAELMKDFATYSISMNGLNYSPVTMSEMVPDIYYDKLTVDEESSTPFNQRLRGTVNEYRYQDVSHNQNLLLLAEQILRHTVDNKDSVLTDVSNYKNFSALDEFAGKNTDDDVVITISRTKGKNESIETFGMKLAAEPYVRYGDNLYKFYRMNGGAAIYRGLPKLGIKNRALEYDLINGTFNQESMYKENNFEISVHANFEMPLDDTPIGISAVAARLADTSPLKKRLNFKIEKLMEEAKQAGDDKALNLIAEAAPSITRESQLNELKEKLCR